MTVPEGAEDDEISMQDLQGQDGKSAKGLLRLPCLAGMVPRRMAGNMRTV